MLNFESKAGKNTAFDRIKIENNFDRVSRLTFHY